MSLILRSLIIIILACSFIFAQKAETPKAELTEELLYPIQEDIALAMSEGLNVVKLLPPGMVKFDKELLQSDGSAYSFTETSHSYDEKPQIRLMGNHLVFGFLEGYGLIADLGQSTPELAMVTSEADFLLKYIPPKFLTAIRAEPKKAAKYKLNGITLRGRIPIVDGNSYLLRSLNFNKSDTLVFFRIHRQDADGSLIIFWKKIKAFEKPVILTRNDEELKVEIETLLRKRGFTFVQIEVKDNVVVLRGKAPRGKMAEVIMTVQESKPRKVENQLSEQ